MSSGASDWGDIQGTGDHVLVPLRKEVMAPLVGCWRMLARLLSIV